MFTFDLDDFELMPTGPGRRVSFPLHSATGTASTATVLFELEPGAELPDAYRQRGGAPHHRPGHRRARVSETRWAGSQRTRSRWSRP